METGDGLLLRFRPVDGALAPEALVAIARAARALGNGLIEITARGSLQLRGARPSTAARLADAVEAAVEVEHGPTVETPPLAGVDPAERADPRPLAAALRRAFEAAGLAERLAPKATVVVDGAGSLTLDGLPADIRLVATEDRGRIAWSLHVAGMPPDVLPTGEVAPAVVRHLETVTESTRRRPCAAVSARRPTVGLHALADGSVALGLGLAFGSVAAADLIDLMSGARALGAAAIRLAPGRAMLVVGLTAGSAAELRNRAAALGLRTEPDDPRGSIAACPGNAGCASGHVAARALAAEMAAVARVLFDGSFDAHVSGCAKGCAHPGAALIGIVGTAEGCALVIDGTASDRPVLTLSPPAAVEGLARLERLLRAQPAGRESAADCLRRLGPSRIAAAFAEGER